MAQNLWIDSNNKAWAIGMGFKSGETTIATAGLPTLLLPVGTETISIIIQTPSGNGASIHIGGIDVHVTNAPGLQLPASSSLGLDLDNSKAPIYIDGTATDKVNWLYLTGRR